MEVGFVAVFANDIVMVLLLEPSTVLAAAPADVLKAPVTSGVNFGVSADETPVG